MINTKQGLHLRYVKSNTYYVLCETRECLKGVLHPRQVFGLFLHFSHKLQHIGNM